MSASERAAAEPAYTPKAITEPVWLKITLIAIALAFSLLFLLIPLAVVFTEALKKVGKPIYWRSAIRMRYRLYA
jgi:ABC-type sulfate transport system permease subunit